ncbi:SBBP repeat-containing protein [Bacteroidota bacterium]
MFYRYNTSKQSNYYSYLLAVILFLLISGTLSLSALANGKKNVVKDYLKIPMSFEENVGQVNSEVKFTSRGQGYTISLTELGATITLSNPNLMLRNEAHDYLLSEFTSDLFNIDFTESNVTTLKMKLLNNLKPASIKGTDILPTISNYYSGNDPSRWIENVHNFKNVRYEEIYDGIDLIYYGNQGRLEYDFIVSPGSDPDNIRFKIDGTEKIEIDPDGNLLLFVNGGVLKQAKPVIYQIIEGEKIIISGSYLIADNNEISFKVGNYDLEKPLTIDPILLYSSYWGGSNFDLSQSIRVCPDGSAVISGYTKSIDYPNTSGFSKVSSDEDVFVTKIDATGSVILFSTIFGGSGYDVSSGGMEIDSDGNIYITGGTLSSNFPTTPGAFSRIQRGWNDGFITKLSSEGQMVSSTLLGGTGGEGSADLALDENNFVYVTGGSNSRNFPVTSNAFQSTNRGWHNGTISILDQDLSTLIYSTYLGGNSNQGGNSIDVDSEGNFTVVGHTESSNFPLLNPLQDTFRGGVNYGNTTASDGFVTKFNSSFEMVYSTYLGGYGREIARTLICDNDGNAYVGGLTTSQDFPTKSAFQSTHGGGPYSNSLWYKNHDGFITKISPDGSEMILSTYFGGNGQDYPITDALALDEFGNLLVVGVTRSTNFPVVSPIQENIGGSSDAFISVFDNNCENLLFSTYLGGTNSDHARGCTIDGNNDIYVTGVTEWIDFPGTIIGETSGGGGDIFACKISMSGDITPPVITLNSEPTVLWPPNHKYETINLSDFLVAVEDPGNGSLPLDNVVISNVSSDEIDDTDGKGDGETLNDILISEDCKSVELRKERDRNGNGRVYTIEVSAMNPSGNIGTAEYKVTVPHDQSGDPAVDDDPLYEVAGCLPEYAQLAKNLYETRVTIEKETTKPTEFELSQNYPNPFNPTTTIRFELPESAHVRLEVYNPIGQLISTLVNNYMEAGFHETVFNAEDVPSGVYVYRMITEKFIISKKMLLLR